MLILWFTDVIINLFIRITKLKNNEILFFMLSNTAFDHLELLWNFISKQIVYFQLKVFYDIIGCKFKQTTMGYKN